MKLTCNLADLQAALSNAASVPPSKSPRAILQYVKIEATGRDVVTLLATDMECGMRIDVAGGNVARNGECLLSKESRDLIQSLGGDSVSIEAGAKSVTITSENSECKLPTEDPADFPTIASFDSESYFEIDAAVIERLIRQTVFAAANGQRNPALDGVLLEMTQEKSLMAACDLRRLAISEGSCRAVGEPESRIDGGVYPVIQSKALLMLMRAMDDELPVSICLAKNSVLFRSGPVTIFSRMIEGRFPPYERVLPVKPPVKATVPVAALLAAAKQSQIFSTPESNGVEFDFSPAGLVVHHKTSVGESRITVLAECNGSHSVCLIPRQIVDFLKAVGDEKSVSIGLAGRQGKNSDAPTVPLFEVPNYRYIVMPLGEVKPR